MLKVHSSIDIHQQPDVTARHMWVCYCALILILSLIVAIFESTQTALAVCAVLISPALIVLLELWRFDRLLMALMFVLSNLFLLHGIVAVKLPDGRVLFGIRDILWLLVLVVGLVKGHDRLRELAKHPLIWPGLLLLCLAPFAALIGMINGGSLSDIIREVYPYTAWAIALVVCANVTDHKTLRFLTGFFILIGVLTSIGAIAEVMSNGDIKLVSTYSEQFLSVGIRVWPDGWVFMFVTLVYAAVALTVHSENKRSQFWVGVIVLVSVSFAMTQMRGMLLTFIGAILLLLMAVTFYRVQWIKLRRLALPSLALCCLSLLGWSVLADSFGSNTVFSIAERYSYAQLSEDTWERQFEVTHVLDKWESHPLTGVGFGVPYYDIPVVPVYGLGDVRMFVHNILAYHLLKFGPVGLALFVVFCLSAANSFLLSVKSGYDPTVTLTRLALTLGLVGLVVEAQAANVFGDARQISVSAIVIGLIVCSERLQRVSTQLASASPNTTLGAHVQ